MRRALHVVVGFFLLALPAAPALAEPERAEISYWESVRESRTPAELEAYLEAYPEGTFAPLARLRLKKLKGASPRGETAKKENKTGGTGATSELTRALDRFGDVLERVRSRFVEKPDDEKLMRAAIDGVLKEFPSGKGRSIFERDHKKNCKNEGGTDNLYKCLDVFGDVLVAVREEHKGKDRKIIEAAINAIIDAKPDDETVAPELGFRDLQDPDTTDRPRKKLTLTAKLGGATSNGQPRPKLGIAMATQGSPFPSCIDANVAKGAVVEDVLPESAAEAAGLQPGDIIQELDGRSVASSYVLKQLVAAKPSGALVTLGVLRTLTPTDVVQRLKDRARANDARAMTCLGYFHYGGLGVEKDKVEANRWFRRGAEAGDPMSMAYLGINLKEGNGITKDAVEANRWNRKAADAGNAWAMNNLAVNLQGGIGLTKDVAEATRWYRKAAKAGNPMAMHNLGTAYDQGLGVEKDPRQAAGWVFMAIKAGEGTTLKQLSENAVAYTKQFRSELQRLIKDAGYYDGSIDGSFGSGTQRAIRALYATDVKEVQSGSVAPSQAPAAAPPPSGLGDLKDLDLDKLD